MRPDRPSRQRQLLVLTCTDGTAGTLHLGGSKPLEVVNGELCSGLAVPHFSVLHYLSCSWSLTGRRDF